MHRGLFLDALGCHLAVQSGICQQFQITEKWSLKNSFSRVYIASFMQTKEILILFKKRNQACKNLERNSVTYKDIA